jgi:hypothetical protein
MLFKYFLTNNFMSSGMSQYPNSATTTQGREDPSPMFDFEVQKCASHCFGCVLQASPEPLAAPSATGGMLDSQTTAFLDEDVGATGGMTTHDNPYETQDMVVSADLKGFLARPVRIASYTWLESDATGTITTFDPWSLFMNNTQIKYKLNNYAFIRGNLKVKIIINASPFYYGAMRACYQPLPNFKNSTVLSDATTNWLIPWSQQPGLWIHPQASEGGIMTLPFFYPKNYLRLGLAADVAGMGRLRMISYTPLASANGATGQGVSIQMYAWMEDVSLAGPSLNLAMQATDEYGTGPISAPASTVALIASKLRTIPLIGKFATATEMGARAVSGIAQLFGFTNVPVISDTQPFRSNPFPQLASGSIGFPVEKLTLDPKNELTIDPGSVGLGQEDELAIQGLVTKDSYLCSTTWTTTSPVDTPLFTSRVNAFQYSTLPANVYMYLTPLAMVANLFAHWRGDVIFTFKVVASPYHKGRLQIAYDPASNAVATTGVVGSAVFNAVLDIGENSTAEIRIPYQQALAWMRVNSTTASTNVPFSTSTTPSISANDTFDNGIISLKVLTLLTAPVASSSVSILVFVRGAENVEFANPVDVGTTMTPFSLQAVPEAINLPMGETSDQPLQERNRVHFGETVRSLRQVLRRSAWSETVFSSVGNSAGIQIFKWSMSRWPSPYGYDPAGLNTAKGTVVPASNFPFNYAKLLPFHWVTNCYIGMRGSGHVHFNVQAPTPISAVHVNRHNQGEQQAGYGTASVATGTISANARAYLTAYQPTAGGVALTNQQTQAGLSVSVPSFTQYKFQSTDPLNILAPPLSGTASHDGSSLETVDMFVTTDASQPLSSVRIQKYNSIGTDFTVFFFLNVPVWTVLSSTPTAV